MSQPSIAVLTAAFYPSTAPLWRLERSCKQFGITLHPYGVGEPFVSWAHAKIGRLIKAIEPIDAEIVLYTDAADTWFLTHLAEIEQRFRRTGANVLVSGEKECYPLRELGERFPVAEYRYPCAGQFMGYRNRLLEVLRLLEELPVPRESSNDQTKWVVGIAERLLGDDVIVDTRAEIFQTTASESKVTLAMNEPLNRIQNIKTGTHPCLLHFNGGGDKEGRMKPYWDECLKVWEKL